MPSLVEHVVDQLDADLVRRRRELSDLRMLAMGAKGSARDSLCRAAHLSAYAHWEGFSKKALSVYLKYVSDSNQPAGTLRCELRALHFSPMIKSAAEAGPERAVELIRAIEGCKSDPVPFLDRSQELLRVGNLMARKLKDLLSMIGLTYRDAYATRENFIDEVLCGRRHRIGHGGLEPVELSSLLEVIDGVMELCDELNDQLQQALLDAEFVEAGGC